MISSKSVLFSILFFSLLGVGRGYGQEHGIDVKFDSIRVKGGHFFIVEDSAIYISNDTTIVVADTVDYFQKKRSLAQTQNFYQNLEKKFHTSWTSRFIYNICFHAPKKPPPVVHENVEISENPYLRYEGKVIGNIYLKKLKIFGSDVKDTTKSETTFITHTLNDLHISTSNSIIHNNLLLREGRLLHPTELADNERVIRSLRYVQDARIYVQPVENSYKTNLVVVTKDVFPIRFDYNSSTPTVAKSIGISNINLFGQGHELENNLVFDNQPGRRFGYDAFYRIPNIRGSFVTGEVNFANHFRKEGWSVRLFRDFLTPDMRYAGGLEVSNRRTRTLQAFNLESDSVVVLEHKANVEDLWLGKSYRSFVSPFTNSVDERMRVLIAGRIRREQFSERPQVLADSNQLFHNNITFLGSIGLASRRYFKDRLIQNFGRTEDIPAGNLLEFTGGYQVGEFYNRYYIGTQFTKGGFVKRFGYVKATLVAGGFIRKKRFEQGVVKLSGDYFTHLYTLGFFKIRQFIKLDYTLGIRRFAQDVINISDRNGIRGLNNFFLTGRQRLAINAETVIFTPLHFVGFRVAVFGFYDFAIIGSNNKSIAKGDRYQGFGFGVRLKNENLAINTIQLRFGFYPQVPLGAQSNDFNFSTSPVNGLQDFNLTTPETLEFN